VDEMLDQWPRHTPEDRRDKGRDPGPENLAPPPLSRSPALHPFEKLTRFGIV
jgi:hypothetical protein